MSSLSWSTESSVLLAVTAPQVAPPLTCDMTSVRMHYYMVFLCLNKHRSIRDKLFWDNSARHKKKNVTQPEDRHSHHDDDDGDDDDDDNPPLRRR